MQRSVVERDSSKSSCFPRVFYYSFPLEFGKKNTHPIITCTVASVSFFPPVFEGVRFQVEWLKGGKGSENFIVLLFYLKSSMNKIRQSGTYNFMGIHCSLCFCRWRSEERKSNSGKFPQQGGMLACFGPFIWVLQKDSKTQCLVCSGICLPIHHFSYSIRFI